MKLAALWVSIVLACFPVNADNPGSELLLVFENGKAGFIDRNGNVAIKPQFAKARDFSEGLAAAWEDVSETSYPPVGYIDPSGKWVIKPQFDDGHGFREGFAKVRLKDENLIWVLVSRSGNIIRMPGDVSPSSMALGDVFEGLARFSPQGDLFGFMDTSGTVVVPPTYTDVGDFHEGLARACQNFCGYVDKHGTVTIPLIYSTMSDFNAGRVRVCKGQTCGYIDRQGRFTPSAEVFLVEGWFGKHMVQYNADGLHAFSKEGRWGFVDDKRHVVVRPQFHSAEEFSEGRAAVGIDEYGQCGYINKTGQFAIPAIFSACGPFRNGLANITQFNGHIGSSMGYVDSNGKLIWLSTIR